MLDKNKLILPENNFAPAAESSGEFVKGVARGVDTLQASGYAFVQSLSDLVGADTVSEWAKDGIEEQLRQAAQNPARISTYQDIKTFGDFGDYVASALGEQIPNLALSFTGGGLAARAAVGKTLANQLNKAARKRAMMKSGTAGAVATTYPMVVGETQMELNDAGVDAPGQALLTGVAKTALEVGPLAKLANDVIGTSRKVKNYSDVFKNASTALRNQAGLEGLTEGAQTLLDKMSVSAHTDQEVFSEDNLHEMFDAILKGGIVGGTMGGITEGVKSQMAMPEQVIPNQSDSIDGKGQRKTTFNEEPVETNFYSGAPAPATDEELNFSADAFLQGRQPAYIQTEGEVLPEQIANDPTIMSMPLNDSADPQLQNATIYFKSADALKAMEQGSGIAQGYGIANKPEPQNIVAAVIPVDSQGRKGSPVLTDAENLENVVTAQEQRSGEGGTIEIIPPESLEEVIAKRVDNINSEDNFLNNVTNAVEEVATGEPSYEFYQPINDNQVTPPSGAEQTGSLVSKIRTFIPENGSLVEKLQAATNAIATIYQNSADQNIVEQDIQKIVNVPITVHEGQELTYAELSNMAAVEQEDTSAERFAFEQEQVQEQQELEWEGTSPIVDKPYVENGAVVENPEETKDGVIAFKDGTEKTVEQVRAQGVKKATRKITEPDGLDFREKKNKRIGERLYKFQDQEGNTQSANLSQLTSEMLDVNRDSNVEVRDGYQRYYDAAIEGLRALHETFGGFTDKQIQQIMQSDVKVALAGDEALSFKQLAQKINEGQKDPIQQMEELANSLPVFMKEALEQAAHSPMETEAVVGRLMRFASEEVGYKLQAHLLKTKNTFRTIPFKQVMQESQELIKTREILSSKETGEFQAPFAAPTAKSVEQSSPIPQNYDNVFNETGKTTQKSGKQKNNSQYGTRSEDPVSGYARQETEQQEHKWRSNTQKPKAQKIAKPKHGKDNIPKEAARTDSTPQQDNWLKSTPEAGDNSVKFSGKFWDKEKKFIDKIRKIFGDTTPLRVYDRSGLERLIKTAKSGKFKTTLPTRPLEIALENLKNGEKGQFIPMGNFGIIVVDNANGPSAKRMLVMAHEMGHFYFNTKFDQLSEHSREQLKKAFEEAHGKRDMAQFEEWFSDQLASYIRDVFINKKAPKQRKVNGVLKDFAKTIYEGFTRIFKALEDVLPARFTTNAKYKRFMDRVIRESLFAGTKYVGFGDPKSFGHADYQNARDRLMRQLNGPTIKAIMRGVNKYLRTADYNLRQLGHNGHKIANIFSVRSNSKDKTSGIETLVADRIYKKGEAFKKGEVVYADGHIYRIRTDHTFAGDFKDSLTNNAIERLSRRKHSTKVNNLKGFLNSAQEEAAKWVHEFKKILPENHEDWDQWILDNKDSPEFTKLMDDLWRNLNKKMGGRLGKKENYLERVYDVAEITNNREAFFQVLKKHLDKNGKTNAAQDAYINGLINHIIENGGVFEDMEIPTDQTISPGMNARKKRTLDNIPDSDLEPFMLPPSSRLFGYIHQATKRAEYETRAGDYNDVISIAAKLKSQRKMGHFVPDDYYDAVMEMADKYREEMANYDKQVAEYTKVIDTSNDLKEVAIARSARSRLHKPEPAVFWDGNAHLDSLLDNMKPKDRMFAQEQINYMMGRKGIDVDPTWNKMGDYVMALQYYTTLAFATISSITDLGNILIRAKSNNMSDFYTNFRDLLNSFKEIGELKEAAAAIGIAQHDIITSIISESYGPTFLDPKVRKANDIFFRLIGLEQFTKATRIMSLSVAKRFLIRHAQSPNSESKRYLKELGVSDNDVITWVELGAPMEFNHEKGKDGTQHPTNKVIRALNRFVDESILRPNAAQRPGWASDKSIHTKMIFQLKSYFWSFGHTILDGQVREFKALRHEGKSIPAATYPMVIAAIPLMALAAIGLEIKEFIKHGTGPAQSDRMGWAEYSVDLFDRAGGFGPFSLALGMLQADKWGNSPLIALLGPSAQHLEVFMNQGLGKGIERSIPYLSQTSSKLLGYEISPF